MKIVVEAGEPENSQGVSGLDAARRDEDVLRASAEAKPLAVFLLLALTGFLALTGREDFMGLLSLVGMVTALALYLFQAAVPGVALMAVSVAGAIGFVLGNWPSGVFLAASLLLAMVYPVVQRRLFSEDDHYFLAPVFFWLIALVVGAVLIAGVALVKGGQSAVEMAGFLPDLVRRSIEMDMDQLHKASGLLSGDLFERIFSWAQHRPLRYVALRILPMQFLITYLAIRWTRSRIRWSHPLWGKLMMFRINVRWSLLLILGMVLFLIGHPLLVDVAVPLLAVFCIGAFLSGIGCMLHLIVRLRLRGHDRFVVVYLCCLIYLTVFVPYALVCFGLTDIWFDMRKLTPKKGEA